MLHQQSSKQELLMQTSINRRDWGQFKGKGMISQNDGTRKRKMMQDPFLWVLNVLVELAKTKCVNTLTVLVALYMGITFLCREGQLIPV